MLSISELGLLLIFAGIALVIVGSIMIAFEARPQRETSREETREETKVGGVIFIGPIPIVFGSDKKIAMWALILGILLFAVYLFLLYFY